MFFSCLESRFSTQSGDIIDSSLKRISGVSYCGSELESSPPPFISTVIATRCPQDLTCSELVLVLSKASNI